MPQCLCRHVPTAPYALPIYRWLIDMRRAITCNPQEATRRTGDRLVIYIREAGIDRIDPAHVFVAHVYMACMSYLHIREGEQGLMGECRRICT